MKNLTLAALLAVGVIAVYTAPSFAQFAAAPRCTVNCGGGGGGDPTEPGDPFIPGDPGDKPGDDPGDKPGDDPGDKPGDDPGDKPGDDPGDKPGDNPGDKPGGKPGKQAAANLRACEARLERLPQVSAAEIDSFGNPRKVTLTPICEEKSLAGVQPVLVEGGNADGLEPSLKANDLIRSKLGQTAYRAGDVVGIDWDKDGNAILFVHKRS